jgi:hypothetical protein
MMIILEEMRSNEDDGKLPEVIAHNVTTMMNATLQGTPLYIAKAADKPTTQ